MQDRISILFVSLLAIMSCQKWQELATDSPVVSFTRSVDSSSENDSSIISKEDALRIVEPITSKYPDRWVDVSNEIILAGTKIAYNTMGHQVDIEDRSYCQSPDYDSWLLVIDKDASYLGSQHLIHIFVDVNSGVYSSIELEGRAIIEWDTSRNIYIPSETISEVDDTEVLRIPERSSGTTRWAVIISGGCNSSNNYSRYYNDCVNIYIKLTQELGYPKGNVYCLISDGTNPALDQRNGQNSYINSNPDLDGDGVNDIQFKANKTNISSVFNFLNALVCPGDEVLVFMTDHGDPNGNFYLWDYETLSPSQLNTELNKLGSSVMIDVVMGQCHSGAFLYPLSAANRTITTSCSATENAVVEEYEYNCFLHYWTEAIPFYAQYGDRYISPYELYLNAYLNVADDSQHPQYSSAPIDFGETHSIAGESIPYILGSDYLSTSTNSLYSIVNYPNPSSVTWSVGHSTSLVSHTDSTAVLIGNITYPGRFCASDTDLQATIIVDGKTHQLRKIIKSVWKPGLCIDGNNIWGSNGSYQVRHLGGEYAYGWQIDNPAWQILGYSDYTVSLSEGYTNNPVNLIVAFHDPLGEVIVVKDRVH